MLAAEEAEVEVENVTNVVKPAISLVHALILLLVVEGTMHLAAATMHLAVAIGLGRYFLFYRRFVGSLSTE